jgi:hypothetical protein
MRHTAWLKLLKVIYWMLAGSILLILGFFSGGAAWSWGF